MPNNIILPCGHESDNLSKECTPCTKYQTDAQFKQLCIKINNDRLTKQKPNIVERVVNAGNAAIRYVASGMPAFLAEELTSERLKVCNTCTENQDGVCVALDPKTGKACGCFVGAKAAVPTEDCALSKWSRLNLPVISNQGKCSACGKK